MQFSSTKAAQPGTNLITSASAAPRAKINASRASSGITSGLFRNLVKVKAALRAFVKAPAGEEKGHFVATTAASRKSGAKAGYSCTVGKTTFYVRLPNIAEGEAPANVAEGTAKMRTHSASSCAEVPLPAAGDKQSSIEPVSPDRNKATDENQAWRPYQSIYTPEQIARVLGIRASEFTFEPWSEPLPLRKRPEH